ncbi:hypothetical protein KP509_20G040200 [Ceratopteris richardii]|uniref:Conserved oligomeric Golgi complex subunit 3 n=1 Tax=Ceratopteris richardii TaxID=49495 RepID=A0A8T2SGS8_CERRI|nr:hypothetical protein KP509_20G040200 [Ceratopteris richardii]KAH7331556.1 hypothetical protein KP509_20G040200 [Ceratopteris richardii]KAH7331557.1 hypothetical protein KP509_20G040200 [Ceratopteris richardii]KAH7331558.1 hypothetical protein KP509_20G040200 [Ceratopteris richardii]
MAAARGSPAPAARPPAVSRGYTFASSWDQNAPLTEQQKVAVAALAQAFSERPMPAHVEDHANGQFPDVTDESSSPASFPNEAVLQNSHQFYQWFTDLESAMKSETEEKYQRYVNTLTEQMQTCDQILEQLENTLQLFDDLQEQHQAVATKTKTLHDACERLVLEKDRLMEFADALRNKLNYFDELENIASQFYSPTMTVANEHFVPLLKRLDECISYVSNNPQYADSGVYGVKFRQLQSRALSMVRTYVLGVLKAAAQQVQAGVKESSVNGKVVMSEAAETSILYVRFKAAANEIKPLMEEIESRKSKAEYAQILADCHSLYCEQRLILVRQVVRQRISDYSKSEPLASLMRQGCAYLMQVCQSEHQLFDHFFSSSSSDSANLAPLIDPLCTILYDILRPKLVHEAELDLLCELVEILKIEVLEEELGRRGDSVAGLKPTILRILADVQERLTFRAQTYMRDEIANYLPSNEDLDYPGKLERKASFVGADMGDEEKDAYEILYAPLEKTLSCLSKLYRCLEPEIFTGLAQDSIGVCSLSIQKASKLIMRQSSQMDGQLFLIKHLLILREQIAPFDIDFAITYKELDFAHLLDHLRRIFRGQASFFDFASRTGFARAFSPRVTENQLDAKKELEKTLKSVCEQFIMSITKLAVEPMLSFITKVTAVKVSMAANIRSGVTGDDTRKSLKSQAFATPEKVAEMVSKVNDSIKEDLPSVANKMKLYLQNSSARTILFKPIKSNIIEAYGQINALINDEYVAEDIAVIGLPQISEIQACLDGLC